MQSVFVLTVPPLLFLLSFRLNGISAEYLKSNLARLDVYKTFSTSDRISISGISSAYVRDKIEKFIDDTSDWLAGGPSSPVFSFNDLPKAYRPEAQKTLTQLKKNAKLDTSGDPLSVSLEKNLTPLKNFYWWVTQGFLLLCGLAIICITGVYFLSESKKESFKGLGSMFLISFFFNILTTGIVLFSQGVLRGLILESPNLPDILKEVYKIISQPIFQTAIKVDIFALGIMLVTSIVLFIISGRLKKA